MDIRIRRAERCQPGFEVVDLESLVVDDHPVRAVWSYVEGLDLGPLYERIKARGETPGRPATDPQILLALWLYATIDGIGAARALDRLCVHHSIYRWICGGVSVNHTLLSEFRADNGAFLDQLLTSSLGALMAEGLVRLDEVITDGTKVRAAASRSSMRSLERLPDLQAQAEERVRTLRQELDADPAASERRLLQRRLSGAEDRARRVAAALAKRPAAAPKPVPPAAGGDDPPPDGTKGEKAKKPKQVRVSTTDPDAMLMKMADGAVRPAYNVQVTSACGFVVAIEPVEQGNDRGLAPAMVAQVERRCGKPPKRLLADVGAMTAPDIIGFAQTHPQMQVFSPPPARKETSKPESKARYERNRAAEPQCLKDWRARMDSEAGQATYKRRSDTEHIHGRMKNRGFGRMFVRGLSKVRTVCVLHAIAHNLIWAISRFAARPA